MMRHNPIRRVASVAVVIMLASMTMLIVPAIVLAHAELVTPTPADKSTVTEPVAEVSGLYSESMKPEGSSLVVKDASGTQVAKGGVDPANDQRMVATPASTLGNGTYTVESTTLAEDGDIAHATWTFTVAVAATPSAVPSAAATAASSAAPTPASATPVATVAPAPSPSGGASTTGSGSDVILPIIVALIALGAGAAYLLTRRNRPTDQT
jgi:methionine-rich copper-binding protein CopC